MIAITGAQVDTNGSNQKDNKQHANNATQYQDDLGSQGVIVQGEGAFGTSNRVLDRANITGIKLLGIIDLK